MVAGVTSFERVTAAIQGKPVDRVPVIPQITYTTAQITGVGLVEALNSPEKTAEALLSGWRQIGYDAVYAGWESSFNLLAEAMGCTMRYPEGDVPQVIEQIVKGPDDLDKVSVPDPFATGRLPVHMKTVELIKREVGDEAPIFSYVPGPFTLAGQLCSASKLMTSTLRDPQFVHDLTEITSAASVRYAEANVEAGVDVIVVSDPTASLSLISPRMFDTFAAPRIKEVLDAAAQKGAVISLHVCGQTTPILDLMCDTGAQILEVDHLVDLSEAKEKAGHRVCLQGNINPADPLFKGTPEAVDQAAKQCLAQAASGGRFILSSGCEIPPLAPIANIEAMVQAAQKYGGYD